MTDPFRPSSRTPPRFVPTLTEVVPMNPAVSPAVASTDVTQELLEEIAAQAVARAEESLAQRLPEALAVMLHEHALAVSESLRRDIKLTVRQSVLEAVASALPNLRIQPRAGDGTGAGPEDREPSEY